MEPFIEQNHLHFFEFFFVWVILWPNGENDLATETRKQEDYTDIQTIQSSCSEIAQPWPDVYSLDHAGAETDVV